MRNLKADLEICNKATPGPWECWLSAVQSGWMVRVGRGEYCDSINTAYYPENKIRTEGYGCDNTFIADLNDDEYHTYSSLQEQIANAKFIAAREVGPMPLSGQSRPRPKTPCYTRWRMRRGKC